MNTTATIAAIATASGAGGIGIVRVSGPHALSLLKTLFHPAGKEKALRPWMLRRGKIVDKDGAVLDDALAVAMPGPKTFTGEDVAEFHCHGGPVQRRGPSRRGQARRRARAAHRLPARTS